MKSRLGVVAVLALGCAHPPREPVPETRGLVEQPDEAPEVAVVRGKLLGHDGKPMKLARAGLIVDADPGRSRPPIVVESDGSFELPSGCTGHAILDLSGVGHRPVAVDLMLDGSDRSIDVRLGTPERIERLDEVVFRAGRQRWKATKRADGIWVATVRHDHDFLTYAVEIPPQEPLLNGQVADRYRFHGQYGYVAVVDVEDGSARLEFDPSKVPPSDLAPVVAFDDADSPSAKAALAKLLARRHGERIEQTIAEAMKTGRDVRAGELATTLADFRALLADQTDPIAKQIIGLSYLVSAEAASVLIEVDRHALASLATEVLDQVDPTVWIWSFEPRAVSSALRFVDDAKARSSLLARLIKHPDPDVSAEAIVIELERRRREGDLEAARELFARLQTSRYGRVSAQRRLARLDPDSPTAPGNKMPAFSVPALDGSQPITHETLLGTPHLVVLWSTWCEPCVAGMGKLHRVYADYNDMSRPRSPRGYRRAKNPRLEILSISFDKDPNEIRAFRRSKWPMPWRHGHAKPDEHTELMKLIGRQHPAQIPVYLLVDETGTIVADRRLMKLDEPLERLLGK